MHRASTTDNPHLVKQVLVWGGRSLGNLQLTYPAENPKTRSGDKTWGTEMMHSQNHSICGWLYNRAKKKSETNLLLYQVTNLPSSYDTSSSDCKETETRALCPIPDSTGVQRCSPVLGQRVCQWGWAIPWWWFLCSLARSVAHLPLLQSQCTSAPILSNAGAGKATAPTQLGPDMLLSGVCLGCTPWIISSTAAEKMF